jgi:hypothetical protein
MCSGVARVRIVFPFVAIARPMESWELDTCPSQRLLSVQWLLETLQEIEALFPWNPPRLKPAPLPPGKKPSTGTRPLAFYDRHIPVHKALQEVKRLPSLIQQLAENVDTALEAALETLPPLGDFITARERKRDIKYSSKIVTDEKGVASFYDKTTARFCAPLASTLALHPQASEWFSLVMWTTSVPHSGYAIMADCSISCPCQRMIASLNLNGQ